MLLLNPFKFHCKMDNQSQSEMVAEAKGLAKWFSVDVVIKIFGLTIWEYHFPPKSNVND